MKKTDDFLTRKLIRYFRLHTTEQAVDVQHLQGNILLRLMTQDIIGKVLDEIPTRERDLIKYVHLQGIQIAVKACVKEEINSPIILSLHDQRFINILKNSYLRTLQENLIYKKLISECYPNYSLTLRSKYIEDTLNLQFKLLTDIGLQPGNNALSFYYRGLYIFNTDFPIKKVKQTGKITVDPIFSTVSIVITPLMQEARLPALTDFQLVEEEPSTSYKAPRLSYTEKGMRIINQPPLTKSFSTSRIPRFQPRSIKATSNNSTYKVKLAYFNGQSWIENKVLIDIGASRCHCIP